MNKRRFGGVLVASVALGALPLGGCLSGQTGSPDCPGADSCVCGTLYGGGALLRVRGETATEGHLVAVVEEVLGSLYGETDVRVGERVGGYVGGHKPCALQETAPLEGAELFVLHYPGIEGDYPNCDAFHACATKDCSGLAEPALSECWSDCDAKTAQSCRESRAAALLNGGFSFILPWGDELDFGGGHRLARSELDVLASSDACLARFPADPLPPCNDTAGSCAVGQPASHRSSAPALALIAASAFIGLARRRMRSMLGR